MNTHKLMFISIMLCVVFQGLAQESRREELEKRNVRLSVEFVEAIRDLNLDKIDQLSSHDFKYEFMADPKILPFGGKHNKEEFLLHLKNRTLTSVNIEVIDTIAQRNKVVIEASLTSQGPNGEFINKYALKFTFRSGKIIEMQEFSDTALFLRAFFPEKIEEDNYS
mmetsp:Transcript_17082/g.17757  ORF Transcript_17082/g.17757 Transcript_17082/m.17757 type:complete len:166 (+) Transcript_17082:12-509(+)